MKRIFTILSIYLFISLQANAQLVINEIDYDQPGVDDAEFIELYNAGSAGINLGDYMVKLFNGNVTSNVFYDSIQLPATTLNAGDYFVIGMAGVINTDLLFTASVQNGSPDAVVIYQNSTGSNIDIVSYEGDCIAPYLEGSGVPLAQSDTLQSDSVAGAYLSIARFPDGTDSNNNSADFNRVCSTPGYANVNTSSGCAPTTGIKQIENKISFSAYPNPSKGIVYVNLSKLNLKDVTILVTDILGKEIMQSSLGDFNGVYGIDLNKYHNGFYFVKVISSEGEAAKRIILSK